MQTHHPRPGPASPAAGLLGQRRKNPSTVRNRSEGIKIRCLDSLSLGSLRLWGSPCSLHVLARQNSYTKKTRHCWLQRREVQVARQATHVAVVSVLTKPNKGGAWSGGWERVHSTASIVSGRHWDEEQTTQRPTTGRVLSHLLGKQIRRCEATKGLEVVEVGLPIPAGINGRRRRPRAPRDTISVAGTHSKEGCVVTQGVGWVGGGDGGRDGAGLASLCPQAHHRDLLGIPQ
jgi:hypothetical protein